MALDKLVDSTQLDSDLTSVANAIRTKGGTSAQLAFPSGFVSAINAISGGGGSSGEADSDFIVLKWEIVTVGTNSVTQAVAAETYLMGLTNAPSNAKQYWMGVIDNTSYIANQYICTDVSQNLANSNQRKFYRYRNGSPASTTVGSSYDAKLRAGDQYLVSWLELTAPTA